MKTRASMVAAAFVLSAAALTACGGGDDSAGDFCSKMKDSIETDAADVSEAEGLEMLDDLADSAPDEIKDDFKAVTDAADIETPDMPDASEMEEMTPEEIQELAEDAQENLPDTEALQKAYDNIRNYAEKECDVKLPE